MTIRTSISLFALVLAAASVGAAPSLFAQTPPTAPQADQDHGAHHPEAKSDAKPGGMGMTGQCGMSGMMGGDMKSMMSMMHDMMAMMSAQSGMMAAHVEERITALRTELKITDAQAPQWNRFADALRGVAKAMNTMHQQMMMQDGKATTLPEAVARSRTMMGAHLESLKALEEALQPLYASLSPEQKKVADTMKVGPMGMM
jgi:hypothetical protein